MNYSIGETEKKIMPYASTAVKLIICSGLVLGVFSLMKKTSEQITQYTTYKNEVSTKHNQPVSSAYKLNN